MADDPQVEKGKRPADSDEREKIKDAKMNAGAVQRGQDNDIHVEQLHADNPTGERAKPGEVLLRRAQEEDGERFTRAEYVETVRSSGVAPGGVRVRMGLEVDFVPGTEAPVSSVLSTWP